MPEVSFYHTTPNSHDNKQSQLNDNKNRHKTILQVIDNGILVHRAIR